MREYKREKDTLESQLRDVQKRSVDHDDHLRIIDAWWTQVLTFPAYSIFRQRLIWLGSYSTKSNFSWKMKFRQMTILKVSSHLIELVNQH